MSLGCGHVQKWTRYLEPFITTSHQEPCQKWSTLSSLGPMAPQKTIRIPEHLQIKLQESALEPHPGKEGEAPGVQPGKGTSPYYQS